jgi:hypothetical protein
MRVKGSKGAVLEDYQKARLFRKPERTGVWKGSISDRVRAAGQLPQAVLKVTSYGYGARGLRTALAYMSRDGELELQTDASEWLDGTPDQLAFAEDWSQTFDAKARNGRGKVRDFMNVTASSPKGSDPDAVLRAAKDWAGRTFGTNHRYAYVRHDDTANPHVHFVVKLRGEDGKRLHMANGAAQAWRQSYAESLRAQGIEVDASPRWARGLGRKAEPQGAEHIRRRGVVPGIDKWAAQEATSGRARQATAFEQSQVKRAEEERLANQRAAAELRARATRAAKSRADVFTASADVLDAYAKTFPKPRSARQTMWDALRAANSKIVKDAPKAREQEAEYGKDRDDL